MKLNFPSYATRCIEILENNGFEAWFVGGCVRDGLLGRDFGDIDITTNAKPEEIMSVFEHTVPTGIKHGTVTVFSDGIPIEITTYRTESDYTDFRHPSKINFVSNISDDLSRRDFTVNSLAYNQNFGILDLFDGNQDLSDKQIITVGDPYKRFEEDALRILRAYRFASVLDFEISPEVIKATEELAELISNVSGERVLSELSKLSSGHSPYKIFDFINQKALSFFGIELFNCDIEVLKLLGTSEIFPENKFALFIALTEHNIERIKERLKPEGKLLRQIALLDLLKASPPPSNKEELKYMLYKHGQTGIILYLEYLMLINKETFDKLSPLYFEIISNNEPYNISQLAINGDDLVRCGLKGKAVGNALDTAVRFVIKHPNKNSYKELTKLIKK